MVHPGVSSLGSTLRKPFAFSFGGGEDGGMVWGVPQSKTCKLFDAGPGVPTGPNKCKNMGSRVPKRGDPNR